MVISAEYDEWENPPRVTNKEEGLKNYLKS